MPFWPSASLYALRDDYADSDNLQCLALRIETLPGHIYVLGWPQFLLAEQTFRSRDGQIERKIADFPELTVLGRSWTKMLLKQNVAATRKARRCPGTVSTT